MLLDKLKTDRMVAKKARDRQRDNLLGTLIAEASKEDKQPADDQIIRTIRKFLKNNEETMAALNRQNADTSVVEREVEILNDYLPAQVRQDDLHKAIEEIVAGLPDRSPRAMGAVMGLLKDRFGQQIDMRLASGMVKAALG